MNTHIRDNLQYLKDVLDGVQGQAVTLSTAIAGGVTHTITDTHATPVSSAISLTIRRQGSEAKEMRLRFLTVSGGEGWDWSMAASGSDFQLVDIGTGNALVVVNISDQFQFKDGSAGTPILSFQADPDTGIYRSGANLLDISTGGTQRAQVSSVGVLAEGASGSAGGFTFINDPDTGFFRGSANTVQLLLGGANLVQATNLLSQYGQNVAWLYTSGAAIAATIGSAVPLTVDRTTNDGTLISLRQDGTEEGTISVSGTTVSYNAFMGAHYAQLRDSQAEPPLYGVVVATGRLVPSENLYYVEDVVEVVDGVPTITGTRHHDRREGPGSAAWRELHGPVKDGFPLVSPSTTPGDPAVYGVWAGKLRDDAAGSSFGEQAKAIYQVAGLGLFKALVTDTGGNLAPGDLLETSNRAFHAQRQIDGVVRASTLGKALIAVDWALVAVAPGLGFKHAVVPAVLYAG